MPSVISTLEKQRQFFIGLGHAFTVRIPPILKMWGREYTDKNFWHAVKNPTPGNVTD